MPASTAASRPSEYENPPTGRAGEASHRVRSRLSVVLMWMAVGAMIVGMRVVMVMAVVVTVTMVRVPAIAVGTGLGLEGLLHLGDGQVHGAQHVGQHVVGLDLEVVGPEFDRHVAVAEVVGGAHEIEAAAVVVVSMAVTVTMTVVVIM